MRVYTTRDTNADTNAAEQQPLFDGIAPQDFTPRVGNEGGPRPPLDKYAKSVGKSGADLAVFTPSEQPQQHATEPEKNNTEISWDSPTNRRTLDQRAKRWNMVHHLWEFSAIKRVRHCKKYFAMFRTTDGDTAKVKEVQVRQSEDKKAVGYAGLQTCGSVWACPACSAKIQAQRRLEIGLLMAIAASKGFTVVFTTYTLRHKKGQALSLLWEGLTYAHQRVKQDKTVGKLRKAHNEVGAVRAVEVTYGDNGWHPHIHSLRFFENEVTQADVDELRRNEFRAWKAAAKKKGLGLPSASAFKMDLVDLGDEHTAGQVGRYMVKDLDEEAKETEQGQKIIDSGKKVSGITFEMQGGATKAARRTKSYTPMELFQEFLDTGNVEFLEKFNEYELASKGKRALTWSPGLKQRFHVREKTDEAIANETVGTEEDRVFGITEAGWQRVVEIRAAAILLNTLQQQGITEAKSLCNQMGISIND